MINNLFDAHVKEQMANARPEVPPHIWENILAKKDKRKPVLFWFTNTTKAIVAGFILLSIAGIAYYFNTNKTNSTTLVNVAAAQRQITNKEHDIAVLPPSTNSVTPLNNVIVSTPKNAVPNKPFYNFSINGTGYKKEDESILATKPNIESNIENLTDPFINNREIFNASLLKGTAFNPLLQHKYLPASPNIPCPEVEKNAAGSKRYIELYGGPDYVFRNYSDTANSVYLQQRKSSIKYLFAYSAGIRYTRVFGSGMSFRTGLNYSQINEQFTSEKGKITQHIYIVNNNGDTTGSYLQSGTLYQTSTNKYKSIDIPISVGYELGNGRIHSNINLGAMVNIHSSQKGFVLDKNGVPVDITSGKSSSIYQYKTKAGVSFIAAASLYYKLNDRLHLMAEPYLKLSLSPATKAEISLKEKFHTTGVRLGVRMDL